MSIGSLLPSNKELQYYRKQFIEAAQLQGYIGKLYRVKESIQNKLDTQYIYHRPIKVPYFLQDKPEISTLSKYGWFVEDRNQMPMIAFLTYLDDKYRNITLQEGDLLELSKLQAVNSNVREKHLFQCIDPQVDTELLIFVTKLVPYRCNDIPINKEKLVGKTESQQDVWFDRSEYD